MRHFVRIGHFKGFFSLGSFMHQNEVGFIGDQLVRHGGIEQQELDLDESETDRSGLMMSMDTLNRK